MDKLLESLDKLAGNVVRFVLGPLAIAALHILILILILPGSLATLRLEGAAGGSLLPPLPIQHALDFYGIKGLLPWIIAGLLLIGLNVWYAVSNAIGSFMPPQLSYERDTLVHALVNEEQAERIFIERPEVDGLDTIVDLMAAHNRSRAGEESHDVRHWIGNLRQGRHRLQSGQILHPAGSLCIPLGCL
ncbi:MAG TPA: hypothetical protein VEA61_00010 [Allosphingosinicella sp.]|nr:hypothetical protein [Allosphingosinicella sp.]